MSSIALSFAAPRDPRGRLWCASRGLCRSATATTLRFAVLLLALVVAAPSAPQAEEAAEVARLEVGDDVGGVPTPRGAHDVTRDNGPILRELKASVAADPAAVLAFYRRELKARDWTEETAGAIDEAGETRRSFSGAEGSAVLVLTPAGGETRISLVIRASEEVVAARALEARVAERASRGEALADPDAASADPGPSNLGATRGILRPRADLALPIPVPETAEAVAHDAATGRLTFTSQASVRALEAFYRGTLKAQGFAEKPHEPRGGAAELEFSRGEDRLVLTFAREGTRVAVTASGGVLKTAGR